MRCNHEDTKGTKVHEGMFVIWAALLLLLAVGAYAQTQTSAAPRVAGPPPAPAREIHFPAFEEQTFANGLRIVVIEQHEQPLVTLRLLVKAGRSFEPSDKIGVASATAALLTNGTKTRSAQEIAEAIDFVGGSLSAGASIESGFVTTSVTSDQIDLGFDLMSDVLLHSTFPQDEVERWRKQTLSNLQVALQRAGYLADSALRRMLFGEHPYGRPSPGTEESIGNLTREDIVAFHRQRYVPNQALLAVVGDITPVDAFVRARRVFGGWSSGEAARIPDVTAAAPKGHRILVIDKPEAVQTEIRIGQVAIAFRDPDLYVSGVYNSVTGGNTSARLFKELRAKRGLTYGASSAFIQPTQPGSFTVRTSTKSASTVEALTVALDVLRDLANDPVPETELAAAKVSITGGFPLEIETADGTADKVLQAMQFGYDRQFLEHYNDKISRVTAADLQRFASERIHPDDMTIVLVGNAKSFSAELKEKFGDFEIIPVTELDFLRPDLKASKEDSLPK